jgi:YHS domain-containing protein
MRIDTDGAVAAAEHEGTTCYLCSRACHDAFEADPASYPARQGVGMDPDRLTGDELAERSGTRRERIKMDGLRQDVGRT